MKKNIIKRFSLAAYFLCCLSLTLWSQKPNDPSDTFKIKTDTTKSTLTTSPKPEIINQGFVPNPIIEKRLKRIQRSVPLPLNKSVQDYIDFYTNRKPDLVAKLLGRSKKFFPIFEPILKSNGVPDEIKYLALVESALNPLAVSPMGAKGPWQFMPGAAKRFDLAINGLVDERKDPYLSTGGAARYLKYMYNRYGDWLLAIASYNCGDGNVDKAIKKAGGQYDFWAIKPYLPKETQNYVPAYIAAVYFMNYYGEHGFSPEYIDYTPTTRIQIRENSKLTNIESWLGVPKSILVLENPSLLTNTIPEGFYLNIPKSKYDDFVALGDSVYLNFASISKKVEIDQELAEKASKIEAEKAKKKTAPVVAKKPTTPTTKKESKPDSTSAVSKLKKLFTKKEKQPTKEKVKEKKKEEKVKVEPIIVETDTSAPIDPNLESVVYRVKDGDNIGLIEGWFQIEGKLIKKWNDLTSNRLSIGQEILLFTPKEDYNKYARLNYLSKRLKDKLIYKSSSRWLKFKTPSVFNFGLRKAKNSSLMHTIKEGESLWIISQQYPGVTVEQLMEWNDLDKKSVLKLGSQIIVGKKSDE